MYNQYSPIRGQNQSAVDRGQLYEGTLPKINDTHLYAELVVEGLDLPTTIAFLGPDDILVTEKNEGTVRRIIDGQVQKEPLIHASVYGRHERGLLGIAIGEESNAFNLEMNVFLYLTEAELRNGTEIPVGNRLYKYDLNNNKLVNPKLLLDLPADPGTSHNGGAIMIGPDNNMYIPIGDVNGSFRGKDSETQTQNYINGVRPDGRSGILRVTQDGQALSDGSILGDEHPLDKYFAYGIRNSFGIDFDPVTGNLWDTENGPDFGDEINLVEPGFNSGWDKVQGLWRPNGSLQGPLTVHPQDLLNFGGKGKYSEPEFIWQHPVGVTALKFFDSDKYGEEYENDMFVGDFNNGNIYHFDLNSNRTELSLEKPLDDRIADTPSELESVIFGEGFGEITDLEVGPYDGYLYVVSVHQGKIFRIVPLNK